MILLWSLPGCHRIRGANHRRRFEMHTAYELIVAIIGGMYFGVVTPTEAAALGCLLSFAFAPFAGN